MTKEGGKMKAAAQDLIDFMHESPTAFHHVLKIENELMRAGFTELTEKEAWIVNPGGKYYVKKNDSSIMAFELGSDDIAKAGMRLIGAHTDSPCFKVKSKTEMAVEGAYLKLNTEMYGGAIAHTWFDRVLSLAGKVTLKGANPFEPDIRFLHLDRPLMTIPSVAIHLKRDTNEKFGVNLQKDSLPLVGLLNEQLEKDGYLMKLVAAELGVGEDDILGFDLNLFDCEKGTLLGANQELISSKGLDDKWMTFAGLGALLNSEPAKSTKVLICVDDEEIGSLTAQGANSQFIPNILERLSIALGKDREQFHQALANSVMISADLAHAVHPNAADLHDPTNRPVLGKGPVLKVAASGSYSTDSYGMAVFKGLCHQHDIPYQALYNRSDVRGGTTIGPITSSLLTIPVIDMGAPLLGMHSIRELGAVADHDSTVKLFTKFYQ